MQFFMGLAALAATMVSANPMVELAGTALESVLPPTASAIAPGGDSSSGFLLDSINRELDDIKRTLQRSLTIQNKWSAYNEQRSKEAQEASKRNTLESLYLLPAEESRDRPYTVCSLPSDGDSIYKYSIAALNQSNVIDFSQFRGKPILLINVATFCESTIEYPLLNDLKEKFGDDLVIVAFPSNQFLNQEPSDLPDEIYNALRYVRPGNGFVPNFQLTKRIDVNGGKAHPIYSFLKRSCPATRTRFADSYKLMYKEKNSRDIRWNFEKFLIHPTTGQPIKRYDQKFKPDRIIPDIEALLEELRKPDQAL